MRLKSLFYAAILFFSLTVILSADDAQAAKTTELVKPSLFQALIDGKSPKSFWWPRSRMMSFQDKTMVLKNENKSQQAVGFSVSLLHEIPGKCRVSLKSKIDDGTAVCSVTFRDRAGFYIKSYSIKLEEGGWHSASKDIDIPSEAASCRLSFQLRGMEAEMRLKDVSMQLHEVATTQKGVFVVYNGQHVPCNTIYLQAARPGVAYYEEKAAKLLKKYIYRATGQALNIKTVQPADSLTLKPGMLLIGNIAVTRNAVNAKTVSSLKAGGYCIQVKDGVVTLVGVKPSGIINAAYKLLEKSLNITFLTERVVEPPLQAQKTALIESCLVHESPKFEFRLLRDGDAIGYTDAASLGDARIVGCKSATTCHTADGLVEYDKYHGEHPEYFALNSQGQRLTKNPKVKRFDIHFCMSNPNVVKLITSQLLRWMAKNPQAIYYYLTFGDGGNQYCKCDACNAMDEKKGIIADRNLKFINQVAAEVAKKFPNNIILTLAYVDTEEPAISTKPLPNVRVLYCPYPRNWSNHLNAFDPVLNKDGIRTLNGWLKLCPDNIYIFAYPSCCGESLNVWPAFYANYEKIKFYAENNIKGIIFCGLRNESGGYPGANSFNAMSRYVLSEVLWNPDIDVEKAIDAFMTLYYGAAAPAMREFFNLIHDDVKKRNFSQHTEEVKRGYMTDALAEHSYAIFAKAEAAVCNQPRFRDRVLREKIYLLFADLSDRCRTNGKINESNFEAYAKHLAEFAKLAKKFRISYFSRKHTPASWFWETALLKLKYSHWSRDPKIAALIKEPVETLGKSIPRCQEKTPTGWFIPMQGVAGGYPLKSYSYKCPLKKNLKVLRRESSGQGFAMTYLYLDHLPNGQAEIAIEGLDSDKKEKAVMQLIVNGKTVYKGPVPFAKNKWQYHSFPVPTGSLQKGKNLIEIKNITPDIVTDEDKKMVEFITTRKKNYRWGWYIISGLKLDFVTPDK